VEFSSGAVTLFERARRRGWWYRAWARLHKRSYTLATFNALYDDSLVRMPGDRGVQIVALKQIRGSEGRFTTFDSGFFPLDDEARQRWQSVATAWMEGVPLPPVELLRLGEHYLVRDGHHRISVARALGINAIEAVVPLAYDHIPVLPTNYVEAAR
jgi:hypothetical protein